MIVGTGGFGKVVLEHATKDYECAFIDDGIEIGKSICGCKVVENTSDITNLESDKDLVTVMFANEKFDENHLDTYFEIV